MKGINLQEGEEVQHVTKPSRWRFLWHYLLVLPVIRAYIARKGTKYYVTTDRVVRTDGILSLETNEFRIEDIREVETKATVLGRMFNVGDIELQTYSEGEMKLPGMPRYRKVASTIRGGLISE